jgi:hypothetical protein
VRSPVAFTLESVDSDLSVLVRLVTPLGDGKTGRVFRPNRP